MERVFAEVRNSCLGSLHEGLHGLGVDRWSAREHERLAAAESLRSMWARQCHHGRDSITVCVAVCRSKVEVGRERQLLYDLQLVGRLVRREGSPGGGNIANSGGALGGAVRWVAVTEVTFIV